MENTYIFGIDTDGYLVLDYNKPGITKITLTEDEFRKIQYGDIYHKGRLVDSEGIFEKIPEKEKEIDWRQLRQEQCFDILDNRSKLGYDNLTKEQYNELMSGYKAWLDITETKTIPTKPDGLK